MLFLVIDLDASIIVGCCGIPPIYIRETRKSLIENLTQKEVTSDLIKDFFNISFKTLTF